MKNKTYFSDKVVVITGASSGIGKEASMIFAGLKAKVILVSRDEEKLEFVRNKIVNDGGYAVVSKTDITSSEDIEKMVKKTIAAYGRIDILIANAGQYINNPAYEVAIDSYKKCMEINFFGTIKTINSVLQDMLRREDGHIVIINSLDSKKGIVGDGPYVASKCALDGFGDVLRQQIKLKGIRVTSIYPGRVDTPMVSGLKVPWISPKIEPGTVVKAIIRGIKKNKAVIIVPRIYVPIGPVNNIFPRMLDWVYRVFRIEGEEVNV
jgi:short-subunit dehydrogenase